MLRFGAGLVALGAVAGYLTVQYVTGGGGAPGCRVVSGAGGAASYAFTPEQAVNAATIAAVGTGRDLPERAVTIALATALQESGLRNIDHGDRDSLGLFQQRPSQGWGTPRQIMDPTYAAGAFYQHLVKVPGYTGLPLTVAAQRVQRSGYPEAYAKHESDAALLSAALTGRSAATLTCGGRKDTRPGAGPDGVRAALVRDFGRDVFEMAGAEVSGRAAATPSPDASAAGKASGPLGTPGSSESPGSSGGSGSAAFGRPGGPEDAAGRTVTVPVPEAGPGGRAGQRSARERGWQLAHWAVANASALHIERVSYADREWVAGTTDGRWRSTAGSGSGSASGSGPGSGPGSGDGPGRNADADAVRIVAGQ
ncbi:MULTISPECIES: heavy metal transporter [unclassified Streptomyces]|uniref:heavy metal transporter n=1 Tax=unclassified Streptomyces TaxID=2593676 RepID=UPI001F039126|nr:MULTISPECIES: heavy metal transporter [unclassified Streptomyces]MCH0564115.1 heavy metal transporter [Streptomyces sp. MUM 2J]MCH0569559.1 heavy metal transporter [Streptomyces sp. MUM 136J]